jgi:Cu2+-exporting ATPase
LILASGQADYYRYREQPAAPVDEQMLDRLADWDAFETPPGAAAQDGLQYADVLVEGIRCSACGWLIERQLQQIQGVAEVQVDIIGREVRIGWQATQCSLADPLRQLVRLGYRPHPGSAEGRRGIDREERRQALRRLGVAGLGMMQVMMVAGGTWFASSGSIDPAVHRFLDLVAMLVATPVVVYAGAPFFSGALRALSAGRVNVDVPVALAIGLAFAASCRNLLAETGPVYFESVSMFVFFLLLGRFVEMVVRQRSVSVSDAVARLLPDTALRLDGEKQTPVPRESLGEGDRVHVRHGEAFPADGEIIQGLTRVDESLLTGESRPLERGPGEQILAGSINLGGPVMIKVGAIGDDLVVSQLQRLLARARGQRPPVARQADRLARYLVAGILVVAVVTWGLWLPHDPEQAFQALLAVLVVTCPCALSLATPSVLAAASVRLSRQGVLVFSSDAITTMANLDRVVFDKTGTLTRGRPTVRVDWLLEGEDEAGLLAVCGSLERGISHPIANAFRDLDGGHEVSGLRIEPGMGLI